MRSSGTGQSPHLTAAWFLQLTGLKMTHVPFRGAGPALTAALGGQVQILFDNLFPVAAADPRRQSRRACHHHAGAQSPLARDCDHARERARACQVRRLVVVWRVPAARCARAVLDALNAELKVFLDRADIKARIDDIGAVPDYTTPAQYTAFIQNEIAKFGEIIAKEKLQMDVN